MPHALACKTSDASACMMTSEQKGKTILENLVDIMISERRYSLLGIILQSNFIAANQIEDAFSDFTNIT